MKLCFYNKAQDYNCILHKWTNHLIYGDKQTSQAYGDRHTGWMAVLLDVEKPNE